MPNPTSPSPAADSAPRWQRRPEERREEILTAAIDLFSRQGFSRTTLTEVAESAGVSKGTLYHYFDTKEALFEEAVLSKFGAGTGAGESLIVSHRGSYKELLRTILHQLWAVVDTPEALKLMILVEFERENFPESAARYFQELELPFRRILKAVLEAGVAAGEFRPVDVEVAMRAIPHMLIGAIHSRFAQQAQDANAPSRERMIDGVLDLVFRGLDARRRESPA